MELLLTILIFLESSGDPNAVNGNAVGCLQITPIYVRDVNRILGAPVFNLQDRLDVEASKEMARVYLTYWGARRGMDVYTLAQLHRGGPTHYRQYKKYGRAAERLWLLMVKKNKAA